MRATVLNPLPPDLAGLASTQSVPIPERLGALSSGRIRTDAACFDRHPGVLARAVGIRLRLVLLAIRT